jgi:hypothetical protein
MVLSSGMAIVLVDGLGAWDDVGVLFSSYMQSKDTLRLCNYI